MNLVKEWMAAATKEEQHELARLAGTSRGHLYHLSSGARVAGPDLARELESASRQLCTASRGRLKVIPRTELCPACKRCEYAQACAG